MARRTTKKKKNLTPEEKLAQALVPVEEQPYPVPGNWCWVKIGSVLTLQAGKNISAKRIQKSSDSNYPYPCFGGNGIRGFVNEYNREGTFPIIGRQGALCGNLNWATGQFYATEHAVVVECSNLINTEWAYYILDYMNLNQYATATAQPGLAVSNIVKLPLSLPPLPEQQRIVDRIESLFAKLDEAREKAQAVVDGFEERKAAILHQAFTGELTAGWRATNGIALSCWQKKRIGDFAEVKGGKRIPKGCVLTTKKTNHPYLRIADFGDDTIDQSDIHYITDEIYQQISRYIIETGDVYISIVGTIGKCGTIPEELNGANLTENAARIITKATLPRYLVGFLSSPTAQEDIKGRIRSATLGKLSLTNIKNIVVPIPPIIEQQKIVTILDMFLKMEYDAKDTATQVIGQIGTMKKSILARAFRGELGTNDPAEESAVELLKQIL